MTPEYVQMLRDALTAANAGIEQIHDDWLEPESWNSAGCGQAAAHCLNISLAIEDALAAPIPSAPLRPMSEATRDRNEWVSLVGAKLESNRYYLAWRPDRHMTFILTGQQIDLMNESSTAEHLSMELTHYRQMPDGPQAAIQAAEVQG